MFLSKYMANQHPKIQLKDARFLYYMFTVYMGRGWGGTVSRNGKICTMCPLILVIYRRYLGFKLIGKHLANVYKNEANLKHLKQSICKLD